MRHPRSHPLPQRHPWCLRLGCFPLRGLPRVFLSRAFRRSPHWRRLPQVPAHRLVLPPPQRWRWKPQRLPRGLPLPGNQPHQCCLRRILWWFLQQPHPLPGRHPSSQMPVAPSQLTPSQLVLPQLAWKQPAQLQPVRSPQPAWSPLLVPLVP